MILNCHKYLEGLFDDLVIDTDYHTNKLQFIVRSGLLGTYRLHLYEIGAVRLYLNRIHSGFVHLNCIGFTRSRYIPERQSSKLNAYLYEVCKRNDYLYQVCSCSKRIRSRANVALMYQSIPSLSIPPSPSPPVDPPGIRTFSLPGGSGFRPTFFALGIGVLNLRNFLQFWKKSAGTFHLFRRDREQLEKQVFLFCFISIFAKTVDVYCIFNNVDHFRPLRSFR